MRQALAAGLALPREAGDARTRFLLACADYLLFAMERLHRQDQALGALLRQRLPAGEQEARRLLDEVGERLAMSRELEEWLGWAAGELRREGAPALVAFESGARRFSADFRGAAPAHRNPLSDWSDRLIGEADWAVIAGVTAQSTAREAELYAAVRAAAPTGADPDAFAPAPPATPPLHAN